MQYLVQLQLPLQAAIFPGRCYPARLNHCETEVWTINSSIEQSFSLLSTIAASKQFKILKSESGSYLKLGCLTPVAKWLDIVELYFSSEDVETGKITKVKAMACSSGLAPLTLPFAPLINLALLWIPFGSGQTTWNFLKDLRNDEKLKEHVTNVDRIQIAWANEDKTSKQ
eukprot:maker-scaffold_53-snap-gene-1.8-mRNA-1 protein AED:0.00 eAED:0.00 QI:91/1/1/1/1/1/2/97/169